MFVLCQASQDRRLKGARAQFSKRGHFRCPSHIFRGESRIGRIVNWRAKRSYFSHASSHRENVASARRVDFTTIRYFSPVV